MGRVLKGLLLWGNGKEGTDLKTGRKIFVCFICFCLFLLTSGFPGLAVQADEKSLSIGGMISRGEVKYEVREKIWRDVDPLHFPVFIGMKVKTGRGTAVIALGSNTQVELAEQGILSIDQPDRVTLLRGRVDFRVPPGVEMNFKVGTLSVAKSKSLQASKAPVTLPGKGETIGSITLHGNGAATVKSYQGNVSIVKGGHVLAALSSRDMVTIPSVTASGDQKVKTAQAGASDSAPPQQKVEEPAGAATQDYALLLWVPLGGIAVGGAAIAIAREEHKPIPRCR